MSKLITARPEHEVVYQDLIALMSHHAEKVTSVELLAIAANIVGKLIALQDQKKMTVEQAMEIVMTNIEHGNLAVVNGLAGFNGIMQ